MLLSRRNQINLVSRKIIFLSLSNNVRPRLLCLILIRWLAPQTSIHEKNFPSVFSLYSCPSLFVFQIDGLCGDVLSFEDFHNLPRYSDDVEDRYDKCYKTQNFSQWRSRLKIFWRQAIICSIVGVYSNIVKIIGCKFNWIFLLKLKTQWFESMIDMTTFLRSPPAWPGERPYSGHQRRCWLLGVPTWAVAAWWLPSVSWESW